MMEMFELVKEKDLQELVLEGRPCSLRENPDSCWEDWVVKSMMALKGNVLRCDSDFAVLFRNKELAQKAVEMELVSGGVAQPGCNRLCKFSDLCVSVSLSMVD